MLRACRLAPPIRSFVPAVAMLVASRAWRAAAGDPARHVARRNGHHDVGPGVGRRRGDPAKGRQRSRCRRRDRVRARRDASERRQHRRRRVHGDPSGRRVAPIDDRLSRARAAQARRRRCISTRRARSFASARRPATSPPACRAPSADLALGAREVRQARRGRIDVMPAVELAEKGFVLSPALARSLNREVERLDGRSTRRRSRRTASRAAAQWNAGDTIVLRDLGRTLRAIATKGPERVLHRMDRRQHRRDDGAQRRPDLASGISPRTRRRCARPSAASIAATS